MVLLRGESTDPVPLGTDVIGVAQGCFVVPLDAEVEKRELQLALADELSSLDDEITDEDVAAAQGLIYRGMGQESLVYTVLVLYELQKTARGAELIAVLSSPMNSSDCLFGRAIAVNEGLRLCKEIVSKTGRRRDLQQFGRLARRILRIIYQGYIWGSWDESRMVSNAEKVWTVDHMRRVDSVSD